MHSSRLQESKPGRRDDNPRTYLTANQLRARYGGRSQMWIARRLQNDPTFPKPFYFGRFRFFALDEIEAWERAQIASRGDVDPDQVTA